MDCNAYKTHVARAFSGAADTYGEAADLHRRVARRLIAAVEGHLSCAAVCADVGCGTGLVAGEMLNAGAARVLAFDLSPAMCRQARRRLAEFGQRLRVTTADGDRLPLPSDRVDLLASSYMLQWAPDPAATLAEWVRVLRPGGTIALAVPVEGSLPELRRALRTALGEQATELLHRFPSIEEIRARVNELKVDVQLVEDHADAIRAPDPRALFRRLRALGVQNAGRGGLRLPPSAARRLLAAFEADAAGQAVATFRTLTLVGTRNQRHT